MPLDRMPFGDHVEDARSPSYVSHRCRAAAGAGVATVVAVVLLLLLLPLSLAAAGLKTTSRALLDDLDCIANNPKDIEVMTKEINRAWETKILRPSPNARERTNSDRQKGCKILLVYPDWFHRGTIGTLQASSHRRIS